MTPTSRLVSLVCLLGLVACGSGDRYHPRGWKKPQNHGLGAKIQLDQCTECHGETLDGNGEAGVDCDSCHRENWRTDCTYCHGGDDDATGAPPRDIYGESTSVFPHTIHGSRTIKPAYDCAECHPDHTDVLSVGHLFVGDDTPAVAETDFALGLSAATTYAEGSCANSYCHGNGQGDNGRATIGSAPFACVSCHAAPTGDLNSFRALSGTHALHMSHGTSCVDCHASVVDAAGELIGPDLHVQGVKDVVFTETAVTWNPTTQTCNGACHLENHLGDRW
ncbi:MAG: hypothetical protein EP330_28420 [Deltaproteobacteria bacterium]|nr:MAG: hypothetical protein EP330_28420 [Deltaproteobacteria bacterium]